MDVVIGLIIWLAPFIVLFIVRYRYKKKLLAFQEEASILLSEKDAEIADYIRKVSEKDGEIFTKNELLDTLKQYQHITDVEAEAKKIHDKAMQVLRESTEKVEAIISDAKTEAQDIRRKAKEATEKNESEASHILALANQKANEVLQNAENKAKEIAGEAYQIKNKADELSNIAKAMKNTINDYGEEYLIPCRSTLDDLAEEFGYKEAGIALKRCRALTKSMVVKNQAAACDYAENTRRLTAIHFVLDAFNGKVDTILSKVKHDNYGKLQQAILDAYTLVNKNGEAFRNARITKAYLDARLDELKWAVAANQLLIDEKEEQKRIKEQIREEERARRDYEKALKEAEKEEKLVQKAMAEARKHLQGANEAERIKLEQQLAELTQKLQEAEAKNQRAISMAQQTRSGHVYIISNIGSFGEHVFKIGMTRRLEPLDRVKELGDASVPFSFDVHAMMFSEDAPALERELHKRFESQQLNKVNPRKEFFKVNLAQIKQATDELQVETRWTMKAEALEFYESLAIEKENESIQAA
ncbi:DUF4041 domain-containing protein [Endozoicomonas sp. SM1973]|uniref:DUF4041 domain-containing protein n=1 Tax=Spartinivicinus marinus TaxID=2994442 RepID=A0A853IH79_9GAMM|nr:DUF4041 domain-containing protein [Spartinivicinus marinus]MCX4030286.1 DUF4041 domain-containing protein [Spartinivicinus marinus]NYZ69868.1 DUF4041 domain-containing protein [Spartinivicinus marinus]